MLILFIQKLLAQSQVGPVEQKMADSLCSAIGRLDMSKITNKQEATAAYTQCVMNYLDIVQDLANEKKVDVANTDDMTKVGIDLAKDLMVMKCAGFMKLATFMANESSADENITTGAFKRIDNKGFDYLVITDSAGSEKSFLWLRQFPGSENFMNNTAKYIGKKFKIKSQDIEVYLPVAKGYYKIKEITGIEVL